MSLSEGVVVVDTADGFGRTQIPDLYDARPTRTLTKSTAAAMTRYLRERVGDGKDDSSVVATGS